MSVAANFSLGSLVSRIQRVLRIWVVDNLSLACISVNTHAVVVPFVLATADASLFVLVFLFVHWWYIHTMIFILWIRW